MRLLKRRLRTGKQIFAPAVRIRREHSFSASFFLNAILAPRCPWLEIYLGMG